MRKLNSTWTTWTTHERLTRLDTNERRHRLHRNDYLDYVRNLTANTNTVVAVKPLKHKPQKPRWWYLKHLVQTAGRIKKLMCLPCGPSNQANPKPKFAPNASTASTTHERLHGLQTNDYIDYTRTSKWTTHERACVCVTLKPL